MATIPTSTVGTGYEIAGVCPAGQYPAICLEINDSFGIERLKYQSDEKELQDVTRFLFGVVDRDGHPRLVQTWEMKISGSSGANLIKFLSSWLGKAPQIGWDYCELRHTGALISVEVRQSRNASLYSVVSGIFPLPEVMQSHLPDPSVFQPLLDQMGQEEEGQKAGVSSSWPPEGWNPHPSAPGYYYRGDLVLTEADLRAQQSASTPPPAPTIPPSPIPPAVPPSPASPVPPSPDPF